MGTPVSLSLIKEELLSSATFTIRVTVGWAFLNENQQFPGIPNTGSTSFDIPFSQERIGLYLQQQIAAYLATVYPDTWDTTEIFLSGDLYSIGRTLTPLPSVILRSFGWQREHDGGTTTVNLGTAANIGTSGTPTLDNDAAGGQYIKYTSAATTGSIAGWFSSTVGSHRKDKYRKTFIFKTGSDITSSRLWIGVFSGSM